MTITVSGLDVLSLHLYMPLGGAWVLDLEADGDELAGNVVVDDGEGNRFAGRVLPRAGEQQGRLAARIVAGRGGIAGMSKTLDVRHFRDVDLRFVLADLLAQTGEQLAPSAQAATLGKRLPFWSIPAVSPGAALKMLTAIAGAGWRLLDTGALWVGVDDYPAAPTFEHDELERDDQLGMVVLAVEAFTLRPGVTLDGRKVGKVEHHLSGPEMRTTYFYA